VSASALTWTLHHFGFVKHLLGDDVNATALLREAISLQCRRINRLCIPESLERCAWVAADQRFFCRAARLFGATAALRESIRAPLPLGDKPLYDPRLQAVKARLDETTFTTLWNEGGAMTIDQAVDYALSDSDETSSLTHATMSI
jgi:hypothetical protein